jgi:hypothetical protein
MQKLAHPYMLLGTALAVWADSPSFAFGIAIA